MVEPWYISLHEEIKDIGFHWYYHCPYMHPNPYYYKYYWWVFWEGSPCEGYKFFSDDLRLCLAKAEELMTNLRKIQKSFWVYNHRCPRLDPINTPFNENHNRWKDVEWAPAFDDDKDPICDGFK